MWIPEFIAKTWRSDLSAAIDNSEHEGSRERHWKDLFSSRLQLIHSVCCYSTEQKGQFLFFQYICSPTRYTKFSNGRVYSSHMLARHVSDLTGPSCSISFTFWSLLFSSKSRGYLYHSFILFLIFRECLKD
jgi:hypothetical protein